MTRSFGLDAPLALEAFKTAAEKFKDDDLNGDLARDLRARWWGDPLGPIEVGLVYPTTISSRAQVANPRGPGAT